MEKGVFIHIITLRKDQRKFYTVRDWDGGRHGDYVPFRFQMSYWKRSGADYVPLPA